MRFRIQSFKYVIAAIIGLCLSYGGLCQTAQAISLGSDVHSQGATITKDYFIYTALDSGNHTNIFRCNRSGTDFSDCQVIVSGNFGHANVLDHEWGTDYFYVDGGGCYTLSGNRTSGSNCKAPANWTADNDGLTGQGRTQYGNYRLKAFGNTHNTRSRIVVRQKSGSGYKTIDKIDINEKPVVLGDYSPEIEDVAVDGDTGEIYYTMSGWFDHQGGDQEVRLYKVSDYTLPTSGNNNSLGSGSTGVCSNGMNLPDAQDGIFSQNNLTFWNPCECEPGSGSSGGGTGLDATGDWSAILNAKNADKSFFNGSGNIKSPWFSDTDQGSMKDLLENYGDLAYQLGRTIGAPWVAIIVQMRYEDSQSECGKNNFWGNGCPPGTGVGGASVQGSNLGEGFAQYGQTLTKICATVGITDPSCQEQFKVSDPKRYLELIGPFWVQGDPNGAGYGSIEDEKRSIDALMNYINTSEGQNIVKGFTNYAGMDYASSSSTPSSGSSTPSSSDTTSSDKSKDDSSGGSSESSGGDCASYEGDYPQYYQAGQSWSSVPYDGGNIGDSGCGPSSMAMIATAVTGKEIHPDDVVSATNPGCYVYTSGSGMTDLDKKVGEKYGFEVVNVDYSSMDDAIAKMKQYLNDGYMLHFSGAGSAPFTSGGHYVGAFGISGDTVHVADSNLGNADYNIRDLVYAGLHGGAFSASKGAKSCSGTGSSGDPVCDGGSGGGGSGGDSTGSGNVLQAVADIIELANKNGSTYTWGGGHTSDASVFDSMLSGSAINVDCTGFASLVMYKAFGKMTSFTSESIFGDSLYEEVSRSDVRPGDIFAYNDPWGHGGIVIEASGGKVTKIAETGGSEGRSGKNDNIGYSGADSYSVTNMNTSNGHFFRWRGGS